jgi:hypothetical protein
MDRLFHRSLSTEQSLARHQHHAFRVRRRSNGILVCDVRLTGEMCVANRTRSLPPRDVFIDVLAWVGDVPSLGHHRLDQVAVRAVAPDRHTKVERT